MFRLLSVLALLIALALANEASVQRAEGDKQLAQGNFGAALEHYHSACSKEPSNYLNFYKRATVYMAQGRTRQALKDLDEVLKLKPDFTKARSRRADLLVKRGSLSKALEDLKELNDPSAQEKITKVREAQQLQERADAAIKTNDHPTVIDALTKLVEITPNDADMRMKRARAFMATGQLGEAVGDVTRVGKLTSGNADAYDLLSHLYYRMGDRQEALKQVRECVKLNDDHACKKFYRRLKKFNKAYDALDAAIEKKRWAEALKKLEAVRELENEETEFVKQMQVVECKAMVNLGRKEKAMEPCNKAIELDAANIQLYMLRAKLYEQLEDFENSVKDFQQAVEIDGQSREAQEGLKRAQKLLKNSNKRDYYKILGVPRNANKRQITKAYRKLAQEWHPDKFEGKEDKEKAEKKFMDIASAKEVLLDPEKRQMFDNGEDPLDPEEERERQSRGNPFRGFNPFGGGFRRQGGGGGGGQNFHFKFQ